VAHRGRIASCSSRLHAACRRAQQVAGVVNALLAKYISAVPIQFPIGALGTFYYGLIPGISEAQAVAVLPLTALSPEAPAGLTGTSYSNNHFSGSGDAVSYTTLDHISINNYDSFDVSGFVAVASCPAVYRSIALRACRFFVPPATGSYTFQMHHTQRGLIEVNGFSAGHLETNNPVCCCSRATDVADPRIPAP
jgi:hypothetical protein